MAGGRNPSRSISYIKQDEPSFLKQFKERVGYQEGPNVDTKREQLPTSRDSDEEDQGDEKPVVVVLKKGDLTQKEVEDLLEQNPDAINSDHEESDNEVQAESGPQPREPEEKSKIVFKKPSKRSTTDNSDDLNASSHKKKKTESNTEKAEKQKQIKAIKNKHLLSFGDDEEEEDG